MRAGLLTRFIKSISKKASDKVHQGGPTAPKSDQGFDTKWTDEILAKNFVQPLPILSHLLAGIEEHAEESEDSENEGSMGNVTRVVMRPAGHSGKAKKGMVILYCEGNHEHHQLQ
ncbi:unnamed protein product [Nesidiocoris tenuis]|uniref:Uncharacterized protein n=1 Tax=Nesidiocoris tenuis TaxID=355587 RepID=A0A6H5G1F7_9HEMI|nr:unnamed protein product [Nesidiocoris tenuis]